MKRCFYIFLSLFSFNLLFFSCGDSKQRSNSDGNTDTSKNVEVKEVLSAEEVENILLKEAKTLPDFAIHTFEDDDLIVKGTASSLVWISAKVPDLGSEATRKGGIFHTALHEYPITYRFIGPNTNFVNNNIMNTSKGLTEMSKETKEFFPVAASHWAFASDNRTVYYKLRENVTWSDGSPCTADDYVWTWKMWNSPYLEDAAYARKGKKIEVKKINKYCISVKWLGSDKITKYELLGRTSLVPYCKKFFNNGKLYEKWYEDFNWKYAPTIGPYVLDEEKTVKDKTLVMKRVKNWWGDSLDYCKNLANFDEIQYILIYGGNEMEKEYFYSTKLDSFILNNALYWHESSFRRVVENGYIERWVFNFTPRVGMSGIFFNLNYPLFIKRPVRYAMYYAIDMQGMIDDIMQGEAKRLHNIGHGQIWVDYDFNNHTIKIPDYDPRKAVVLLEQAGYDIVGSDGIRKNLYGERVSFELLYNDPDKTTWFAYIKEQAKKAGIEIKLNLAIKQLNGQVKSELVFGKKFQAVYWSWPFQKEPDLWQHFHSVEAGKTGTKNINSFSDKKLDKLLERADDPYVLLAEKTEINKKVEKIIHTEALVVPDFYENFTRMATWKWLKFPAWANMKYQSSPLGDDIFWSYAWIDENIKKELKESERTSRVFEPRVWELSTRYKKTK